MKIYAHKGEKWNEIQVTPEELGGLSLVHLITGYMGHIPSIALHHRKIGTEEFLLLFPHYGPPPGRLPKEVEELEDSAAEALSAQLNEDGPGAGMGMESSSDHERRQFDLFEDGLGVVPHPVQQHRRDSPEDF